MQKNQSRVLRAGLLTVAAGLSGSATADAKNATADRPNVVLIYADDLGWGDLSINGGKTPTPNIDRIFNRGVRFNSFYTHAVCSPSRAGFLTGRHYINVKAGPLTGGELALEETTMAESFKAAGYATGAFGKWHNGAPTSYGDYKVKEGENIYPLGNGVNAHGFDRFVGYYGGGWDYFKRYSEMYKHVVWYHDRTNVPDEEGYTTDLITRHALEFMDSHKDRPFFCYIPHEAVHAPFQAKYEDILRVPESVRNGTALLSKEEYESYFLVPQAWTRLPKEQVPIVYSAMLISLDENVGKVLDWLDTNGLLETTIILFASDNGATPAGRNFPLRGGKHTMYEGGIRVPTALWWENGKLSGGRTLDLDFGYLDVYPTLCVLCGITPLPGLPLDGRNLSEAMLSGTRLPTVPHHWVWEDEGAVRDGRWKLIYNLANMRLFDLENDLAETTNLAAERPETVERLKRMHEEWLAEVRCVPSYAVPQPAKEVRPAPDGDILEFYAEQIEPVQSPHQGLKFIFALGYGHEYLDAPAPGDVIEYDICVAEDGQLDGFFYTPSNGWDPVYLRKTGYDQFGRLQIHGPGPRGGRGVWEHRVLGVGNSCPNRVPFNMMIMGNKTPGIYHFYIDNLVVRKADGRLITMWKSGADSLKRWDKPPFMITPDHKAFRNVRTGAVPLERAGIPAEGRSEKDAGKKIEGKFEQKPVAKKAV